MAVADTSAEKLPLTPRQMEIFRLVARGLSNREICELLGISNNTVKIHVTGILRNLNVSNRTEAVYAYREMLEEQAPENPLATQVRMVDRIGRPSIAVLPFEDLQPGEDRDHLLDGIMEELLVRLSSWQWFPVIAYASSRSFSSTESEPKTVGEHLGARYLICGSLRRHDDVVRVTVRLVDATAGLDVWSHTFESTLGNLFDLQEEIARNIVTAMAPELLGAEEADVLNRQRADYTTWDYCCRGFWHLNRTNREDLKKALDYFDLATQADPDFGLGWHGRVSTLQLSLYEQWCDDARQCVKDLHAAARRCLDTDARSSHAHADMGLANILLGRRDEAISHLEKSVGINPSSARALSLLAQAYGMAGRLDECIMQLEELLKVDPHSASAYRYRTILGMCHFVRGDYDAALTACREAISFREDATGAYLAMIASFEAMGDHEAALAAVSRLREAAPDFTLQGRLMMMQPFTEERLLDRLRTHLAAAGLTE
ncbi:MAG: LuxR C-terminal-related transcriptional regulator [Pseudomonadales bacterium]